MSERRYELVGCEVVAINGDKVGDEAYERYVCANLAEAFMVMFHLEQADEYSSISLVYGAKKRGGRNEQDD